VSGLPEEGRGAPRSTGGPSGGTSGDAGSGGAEASALLHVLLNLAFIAAFAFLYHSAGALPDSRWEPLGSGTFPRIVLVTLILLSVLMIATKLRQAADEVRENRRDFGRIVGDALASSFLVIATFLLFGLFLLAIAPLGFVLSAFLFILTLQLILARITVKGVIVAVAVAAVTAVGVDFVFETYFGVFLPQGRLWR
jgi:putative tricarboxylic transport membrane protein